METELQQVIVGGVLSVLSAIVGYVLLRVEGYVKAKTGIEIEARHREALHRALDTGARAAVSKITGNWDAADEAAIRKELSDQIKAYIRGSVPDALKTLKPSEDVKNELIESAVQKAINEIRKSRQ